MAVSSYKNILLAGATGMGGSAILKALKARYPHAQVRALWHKHTQPFLFTNDPQVTWVQADLCREDDCRRAATGTDLVIVAAVFTGGSVFVDSHWLEHVKVNLLMNLQILEACAKENVARVIWLNSATLYPESQQPVREEDLDLTKDPSPRYFGFGWAQRFLEKHSLFLRQHSGIEILIGRCSNLYGPYAPFDPARSNVVSALIRKAVEHMDPFEIWGNPSASRDILYIEDFAEAVMKMIEHPACYETFTDPTGYDILNIGSGLATTVDEIATLALKHAHHKPGEIRYTGNKPESYRSIVLDISKAKRVLGWQPVHSVESGIQHTMSWWQENKSWWTK